MQREIKQKWVEALRSGKYIQGKNNLRKDGKHCCLGVLAEICNMEISNELNNGGAIIEEGIDKSYYPIYNLLGGSTISSVLASKNDNGSTFEEIADFIEQTL